MATDGYASYVCMYHEGADHGSTSVLDHSKGALGTHRASAGLSRRERGVVEWNSRNCQEAASCQQTITKVKSESEVCPRKDPTSTLGIFDLLSPIIYPDHYRTNIHDNAKSYMYRFLRSVSERKLCSRMRIKRPLCYSLREINSMRRLSYGCFLRRQEDT